MGAQKKPCAAPGCKGWAVAGSIFCQGHSGASLLNEETLAAQPESLYSRYISREEEALLAVTGGTGLEHEIKLARLNVKRLLDEGDHEAVSKALLVVSRLMESHRRLVGDQATGIVNALAQILSELGIGESGVS
ncbi:MAG TPA: hypothetical protein VH186_01165 [Chloroflexia bacterium]|nr:hypothetical protein [Chloroflexia bacterium]